MNFTLSQLYNNYNFNNIFYNYTKISPFSVKYISLTI